MIKASRTEPAPTTNHHAPTNLTLSNTVVLNELGAAAQDDSDVENPIIARENGFLPSGENVYHNAGLYADDDPAFDVKF